MIYAMTEKYFDIKEIREEIIRNSKQLTGETFPPDDPKADITRELSDIVPEGTWKAPQFFVRKGAELGYHGHVYRTLGQKDLGLMITMIENEVYIENHRVGKVKRVYSVDKIGKKDLEELVFQAGMNMSNVPCENRRRPSADAVHIGTYRQER